MSSTLRARLLRRREALELALSALGTPLWLRAGAAVGWLGCAADAGPMEEPVTIPDPNSLPESAALSLDYFADTDAEAIKAIGRARLRQVEDVETAFEDTLDVLEAAATEADVAARLRQAVMDDFEQRRVVRVEGWVLSRTEADFCALFTALAG